MIFKSEHMTQASGSIAGVTYSRAKGGTLYRRARAIPVNPQTNNQTQVRDAMTQLVNRWITTLTPAQRTGWNLYGQNTLVTNKLGDAVARSGQNWYIACNVPRVQEDTKLSGGLSIIDDAPAEFDRGDFTTPSISSIDTTLGITLAYTNTDDWANGQEGALLVFMGRPRNPSRLFFKGPYALVGSVIGDPTPPTSPLVINPATTASRAFPLVVGQAVDIVVAVTQTDGRISTRRNLGTTIVT